MLTDNKTTFADNKLMDMLNETSTMNGALKVFLSMNDNVFFLSIRSIGIVIDIVEN